MKNYSALSLDQIRELDTISDTEKRELLAAKQA